MHSTKSEPNVNCGLGVMVPCQGWAIHWCRMSRAGQAMRVGDEGCVWPLYLPLEFAVNLSVL